MVVVLPENAWLYQVAMSLYFVSYLSTNILVLRFVLASASICLIFWAAFDLAVSVDTIAWNGVFFIINLCHGSYILWQMRPVKFKSPVFEDVYSKTFAAPMSAMSRNDFKTLSSVGYVRELKAGSSYADRGNKVHSLSILISGKMGVYSHAKNTDGVAKESLVNYIKPFHFLDSPQWMNHLRRGNDDATDVFLVTLRANEDCKYVMWPIEALEELCEEHPRFRTYLESVVGFDVARKMLATDLLRIESKNGSPEPVVAEVRVSVSEVSSVPTGEFAV